MTTQDRYGIPDRVFGVVPDDFYGLVGRVALLAGLLDERVLSMTCVLRAEREEAHAGKPTAELLRLARHGLDRHERELAAATSELLERSRRALERRHEIVHSVWPNPTLIEARGWRPVTERRRIDEHPVRWVEASEAKLQQLVLELVDLVDAHDRLRLRVPFRPSAGVSQ